MRIKRIVTVVGLGIAVAAASPLAAQQRRGGAGGGTGPNVALGAAFSASGSVVSLQAGYGQTMPTLVVRDGSGQETAYVLGPFPVLQAQGFAAQAGDAVEVSGWACATCQHGVVVGEVKNVTRSLTLVLRTADGTPAWSGPAGQGVRRHLGGPPAGSGAQGLGTASGQGIGGAVTGGRGLCSGTGPDLGRTATFSGVVKSFSGAPGVGFPTLTVDTAQGETAIQLSPYRALRRSGYEPTAGARVEVTAAPVVVDGQDHWVALAITDVASGVTITLRDSSTGLPFSGGRCARR